MEEKLQLTFSTEAEARAYDMGLAVGEGRGVESERNRILGVAKGLMKEDKVEDGFQIETAMRQCERIGWNAALAKLADEVGNV